MDWRETQVLLVHTAVNSAIKSIVNPSRQQCSSNVVPYTECVFTVTASGGLLMLWLSRTKETGKRLES